ncbi:MAG TPA: hypothetical protein VFV87_07880 [Pirellulaceae bacterium]|nr:hypothetical protein [Pirellulaceae bacterium]
MLRFSFPMLVWCGITLVAAAQESPDKEAAREARLKAMQQIAGRFKVQAGEGAERKDVPLLEAPLLRFNDPARDFHDATIWGWGEEGRPLCLLTVEQYGERSWFECISLAADPFAAEAETLRWSPKAAGVELQPYPDAPAVADKAPRRLIQMKELLGELRAYEVGHDGSRYELRLMPKQLHRYDNAEAGLVDGAIFAFAYGTNPELLALIEARLPAEAAPTADKLTADKPAAAQWQVGFARCGTAEPHVLLAEKEIFTLPYARGTKPGDAYWNFSYQFKKAE